LCNNVGKFLSFDHDPICDIFLLTQMGDFDTLASSSSYL
jgi:hypothetical protein